MNKNIEERLERIEDMLEELLNKQQEMVDAVQGYVEGLGETVRDAESSLTQATEEIGELVESTGEDEEGAQGAFANEDELYEEARGFVVAEQRASTSLLQRRFKIGYAFAARLLDRLAKDGVIEQRDSPSRPWKVLVERGEGYAFEPLTEEDKDEMFEKVAAFAREEGRISTSSMQRKFKVGYGRAARIIDQLEETGVVGPADGKNPWRIVVG